MWSGRSRRTPTSKEPIEARERRTAERRNRQVSERERRKDRFTGFLIADGYTAYQQMLPRLAGIQQCAAHVIRRCRAVAGLGPGSLQSWAADVIEILREAHRLTEEARARGEPSDAEQLAKLRERYDEAVAFGIIHNRLRDWHDGNHPGYVLGCWPRDYAGQVWLFTREPAVEWTTTELSRTFA